MYLVQNSYKNDLSCFMESLKGEILQPSFKKKKLSDPKIKPENFIIVLDYASKILDFPINTTYYFTESNMPA